MNSPSPGQFDDRIGVLQNFPAWYSHLNPFKHDVLPPGQAIFESGTEREDSDMLISPADNSRIRFEDTRPTDATGLFFRLRSGR